MESGKTDQNHTNYFVMAPNLGPMVLLSCVDRVEQGMFFAMYNI